MPPSNAVGHDVSGQCGAPPGRNSNLLSHNGLRRHPGTSPGAMHGPALRAEFGLSLFLLSPLVKVPSGPKTHGTSAFQRSPESANQSP